MILPGINQRIEWGSRSSLVPIWSVIRILLEKIVRQAQYNVFTWKTKLEQSTWNQSQMKKLHTYIMRYIIVIMNAANEHWHPGRTRSRMWKFAAEQDYHQWLIFLLRIISDTSDDWVTCIGWIITDYQKSCYTLNSVWELEMHNHMGGLD